jgi:hypothetical protein
VNKDATVYTDSDKANNKLNKHYRKQKMVNNFAREYVRDQRHTNGIENCWTLPNRTLKGIYVQVSRKHLNRYLVEKAFGFNTRKEINNERFRRALTHIFGKRLTWDELV